jgi:hypothetical protein
MSETFTDDQWVELLKRIKDGRCTPFLGAGACYGTLPLGGDIAKQWAEDNEYPLADKHDLAKVSQFVAVEKDDAMSPKEQILRDLFKGEPSPDFDNIDEPHAVLADLPLPVYLTTNYDGFMLDALIHKKKAAKREICRWNSYIKDLPMPLDSDFDPSPASPLVFHLHGHRDTVESLVLTEDDYLDFLVNVSKDGKIIPYRIQKAMAGSSLLFVGYSLADWNFRILFRGLVNTMESSLRRASITVQLPPGNDKASQEQAQNYLDKYFNGYKMKVYWGKASDFVGELRSRWQEFSKGE